MNITKIIFYDQKELYKIFKELNDFFNLNIQSVTNKNDLKLLIKDSNNFLIITNNLISNFKNQLIIDNKPLKIQKILEKINIEILKNNYSQKSNIKIGNYLLNINSREIFLNKKSLKLTEQEIKMIMYLSKSEKPVTINELQSKIWSYASSLETHTVETHIHRLRKKILDLFNDENFILSTKKGYLIN